MPRDIIDDPLPHRYRNAAEGGRRDGESGRHEAGGHPAGEAEQDGTTAATTLGGTGATGRRRELATRQVLPTGARAAKPGGDGLKRPRGKA